jgi:hypothetical protein
MTAATGISTTSSSAFLLRVLDEAWLNFHRPMYRISQQLMELANTEGLAPASSISACIQPFDDFFNPKRAGATVTEKIEFENEPHRVGLYRVDLELHF